MKYSELNLDPRIITAIDKLGYTEATPIQEQTIPHILEAKDVAGLAQTGTGKTAAFLIPLIERILKVQTEPESVRAFKNWHARSFVLILVPTRELADQINDNVVKLNIATGLRSYPLYGGTGYERQKEALQSGLQFVVSTPGRLIDLYKENHVDLKQVAAIVFDEADRMFDMGFKDDMTYILGRVPRERQFLVFSATLNFDVLNTAYQFGAEPVEINISRDQAKAENVQDVIMHIGHEEKPQYLLSVLKKVNPKQTMIFTNFKHNVDRIALFLAQNKIPAMGISSLMNQSQRNSVIEKFKAENDQNILVATDVAARGLDINGVDLVINYEMPQDAESYVHRIGRTGRAGNEGKAYSLICDRDIDSLYRVEEYTKKKIDAVYLEDGELVKDFSRFGADENSYKKRFEGGGRDFKPRDKGGRGDRGGGRNFERKPRPAKPDGVHAGGYVPGAVGKPRNLEANGGVANGPRPARAPGRERDPKNSDKQNRTHHKKQNFSDKHQSTGQDVKSFGTQQAAKGGNSRHSGPGRNFRSNAGAAKVGGGKKTITQKVKSFFQKIFG